VPLSSLSHLNPEAAAKMSSSLQCREPSRSKWFSFSTLPLFDTFAQMNDKRDANRTRARCPIRFQGSPSAVGLRTKETREAEAHPQARTHVCWRRSPPSSPLPLPPRRPTVFSRRWLAGPTATKAGRTSSTLSATTTTSVVASARVAGELSVSLGGGGGGHTARNKRRLRTPAPWCWLARYCESKSREASAAASSSSASPSLIGEGATCEEGERGRAVGGETCKPRAGVKFPQRDCPDCGGNCWPRHRHRRGQPSHVKPRWLSSLPLLPLLVLSQLLARLHRPQNSLSHGIWRGIHYNSGAAGYIKMSISPATTYSRSSTHSFFLSLLLFYFFFSTSRNGDACKTSAPMEVEVSNELGLRESWRVWART
jgi:hypothetical protein